ncbi:MAG: LicD family protein [Candidatus Cloacimonetes bacterium]|nr:LicD family protein [Candidatus Cloacimonadota bacterium]
MAGVVKLTGEYGQKALKLLADITAILEAHHIPYVVDAGTLLGIVRENRLLPWDTDMDLSITANYASQLMKLRWIIWKAGYRAKIKYYKRDLGLFKKGMPRLMRISCRKFFFFKDVNLMDIFIKYLVDDEYCWVHTNDNPTLKFYPRHFYEEMTSYEFNGKSYSFPSDYIGYLTYHYGDWQTVKKQWNSLHDDTVKKVYLKPSQPEN